MQSKLSLDAADARAIVAAALAYAEAHGLQVSIAVVDEAAHMLHVVRMDGAPYLSADGAIAKARTAADAGVPTTYFEEKLNAGPYSMLKMPLHLIEGGVPVVAERRCVGAIGVAGALPELDAAIADAGLQALDISMADACTSAAAPDGNG